MTKGERKHIIVSLVSCLLAWVAPVHGQNLEKALQEGEVVWYTPTAIEDSQKMVQGFQKKYPAVKVTLFRGRESLAAQQVRFRYGHTLVAQLMAAGEFEISLAFSDRIEKLKAQGVPGDWGT